MAVSVAPGRLRQTELVSGDRNYAVWMHLSPLLAFLVVGPFAGVLPLILWLARRDQSPFADDHGREVVNVSITGAFLFVIGLITGIGMLVWVVWLVMTLVNLIRGATAAGSGEYFRYPMVIRFLT